jgi:hypothetical protein
MTNKARILFFPSPVYIQTKHIFASVYIFFKWLKALFGLTVKAAVTGSDKP